MTILLKQLFGFLKLLNSETGTYQIATGIACGFVLGMSPFFSIQSFLIFFLLFIFRIQIGAALTSAFFFKFIAYLLDPIFDIVGKKLLEEASLQDLWTTMYNLPIVPFTKFNNSIVMGSGATALLLTPFIFLLSVILVRKYRVHIVARFKSTKAWQAFRATDIYQWYDKLNKAHKLYERY